jgi:hypothetical protein
MRERIEVENRKQMRAEGSIPGDLSPILNVCLHSLLPEAETEGSTVKRL